DHDSVLADFIPVASIGAISPPELVRDNHRGLRERQRVCPPPRGSRYARFMGRLWLVVAVIATSTSLACGPRPPASATKPATSSATTIDETNVARAENEHDRPEDRVQ